MKNLLLVVGIVIVAVIAYLKFGPKEEPKPETKTIKTEKAPEVSPDAQVSKPEKSPSTEPAVDKVKDDADAKAKAEKEAKEDAKKKAYAEAKAEYRKYGAALNKFEAAKCDCIPSEYNKCKKLYQDWRKLEEQVAPKKKEVYEAKVNIKRVAQSLQRKRSVKDRIGWRWRDDPPTTKNPLPAPKNRKGKRIVWIYPDDQREVKIAAAKAKYTQLATELDHLAKNCEKAEAEYLKACRYYKTTLIKKYQEAKQELAKLK